MKDPWRAHPRHVAIWPRGASGPRKCRRSQICQRRPWGKWNRIPTSQGKMPRTRCTCRRFPRCALPTHLHLRAKTLQAEAATTCLETASTVTRPQLIVVLRAVEQDKLRKKANESCNIMTIHRCVYKICMLWQWLHCETTNMSNNNHQRRHFTASIDIWLKKPNNLWISRMWQLWTILVGLMCGRSPKAP